MRVWELCRFAIMRADNGFDVISPAGGYYQFDQETVIELLNLHGRQPSAVLSEVEQFAVEEFLVTIRNSTEIEAPFAINRVIANLDDPIFQTLTLCDLAIFLSRRCNYRCLGCSVSAPSTDSITEPIEWQKVITDGSLFGAINLAISGGEPILPNQVDEITDLVRFARSIGYQKVVIATNGSHVPHFAESLKEAGVTRLSISYHGSADYARCYTGCPKAQENSRQAILAALECGLHVGVNCVVTQANIDQIDQVVDDVFALIQGHPHAYLRFSPLVEVGLASQAVTYQLDPKDYRQLFIKIAHWREQFGNLVRLTCDEECSADDPMICDAGLVYALVNDRGDVSACDLLEDALPVSSLSVGSFFEIWNNSSLWWSFRNISPINQRCQACGIKQRQVCFGRCRALSYIRQGSLHMGDSPNERGCLM